MQCTTSLTHLPIVPRLPRALVFILIVSLLLHLYPLLQTPFLNPGALPCLTLAAGRCHPCRVRGRMPRALTLPRSSWDALRNIGTRLFARSVLLVVLLHSSGWLTLTPWTQTLLLIPLLLHTG